MLDAMEAPPLPGGADAGFTGVPGAAPSPSDSAPHKKPASAPLRDGPGWALAIGAIATAISIAAGLRWRRRRRVRTPNDRRPSIAHAFAADAPVQPPRAAALKSPEWVYVDSPYATPLLYMVPEPVDLLLPVATVSEPATATPTSSRRRQALLMELQAIDTSPALHLIGDRQFPEIRRVGEGSASADAWQAILEDTSKGDDDDARLARWLSPAILVLRSRDHRRRCAEALLEDAAQRTRDGMNRATEDERPHWVGRAIRVELARIERLSGATRLFALRALQSRQLIDLGAEEAPVLDAWIDVQLAWAGWLLGGGATARQAEAEALCDRLAAIGPEAATRALRRRAEVFLQRAENEKAAARLANLGCAQALLEDAYTRDHDAGNALLLARCARLRAMTLPPTDAVDACAVALTHAFLAEQDPAWRMDALECRLAVQLTYESLPGRAIQGEVAASLGRELASMAADSVGARTAMAATRLREGDFAGASALCEAAWRSGGGDTHLLNLWRDACRGWTQTADTTGHDRHALAQAVRQLAIARATL
ncbi:hypothetical protein Y886_02495 [Xanthomonas hyacinthi DSM 19077]|nr:hypothetical protein Y886_02495 [Xanthomonas hyacinthi DSM 19077]